MDDLYTILHSLEILYASLAEFTFWLELYDSSLFLDSISSPEFISTWLKNVIRDLEAELTAIIGRNESRQYLNLCKGLFLDRYIHLQMIFSSSR